MKKETPMLHIEKIAKHFYGVTAIDNASLHVRKGTIHAILGENGAGKTSLMNVLSGIYQPDSGQMKINGREYRPSSPRDALNRGIGMVHQHFRLVPSFTVGENISLGFHQNKLLFRRSQVHQKVQALLDQYQSKLDPQTPVWQLSVGEQQRVELYKALYREADVLILDEPTAVLTPQEVKELFRMLRSLTANGKTILFITHKLKEVMEISDSVTIMKQGAVTATLNTSATSMEELAGLMMGDSISLRQGETIPAASLQSPSNEIVLRGENLSTPEHGFGCSLKEVSFTLKAGEIFGIAGVSGNGQQELAEVLTGIQKRSSGSLKMGEKEMTNKNPQEWIREGMAYIPADRLGEGLLPDLGLKENFLLRKFFSPSYQNGCWLNQRASQQASERIVQEFGIKVSRLDNPVKFLSGGNLQRLLIGRELDGAPQVILAVNPARGLDIQGVEMVRRILKQQRDSGKSVLLISEDLDELTTLSNRLAVLYNGSLSPSIPQEEFDLMTIGLMMGGAEKTGVTNNEQASHS